MVATFCWSILWLWAQRQTGGGETEAQVSEMGCKLDALPVMNELPAA